MRIDDRHRATVASISDAHDVDIPATLAQIVAAQDEEYTWITGEVKLFLRTGETVEGVLERLEGDVAVVATPAEERHVRIAEVENVHIQMQSPGPE